MALKRVTMQDIANACGLSRNTVSKIFNDRGAVPETTRRMVLKTAQELGYHQLPGEEPAKQEPRSQNIALLTSHMPVDYHFGTFLIPAFAGQLSRAGHTLMMYEVDQDELRAGRLPAHMSLEQTAGILCIELLDRDYLEMLYGLDIPIISVDTYAGAGSSLIQCDVISMENVASTVALTNHLLSAGAQRIGFVGDIDHCNSFYERWTGFCLAMSSAGMAVDKSLCILTSDGAPYSDPAWLFSQLRQMPVMPDALICANDFIAIQLMTALKQQGISIPEQIMVAGFDGTHQSAVVEPSLTTVQIPGTELGRIAAEMLLERIENPGKPFRCTYVKTVPLWRNSTARK